MALNGRIRVPSDKSISHRAVLFAALAGGTSRLRDLLASDDVLCSIEAVRALGARVELSAGEHGLSGSVTGFGGVPAHADGLDVDCGNSGTTTRLLLGMLAGLNAGARLHGDASLSARPMERVMAPLRAMGARFESDEGHLPVQVLPHGPLSGIGYASPQASAQVKSAVLLAGLHAQGTTSVTEPAPSRDHTERLLPAFGVPVRRDGLAVSLSGPARLTACDVSAPADPSSAAFVAVAAAAVPGSDVTVEQVALNPTRIGALKAMERMGADISYANLRELGAEPVGDVRVRYSPALEATAVAPDEIPALVDEIPVLAVLAARAHGQTVFEGAGELRVKESDRFAAVREGLAAFGVATREEGDDLVVVGAPDSQAPGTAGSVKLACRHDHRLAMTWHLAGRIFGRAVELDDPACVSVSWPGFFEDIEALER